MLGRSSSALGKAHRCHLSATALPLQPFDGRRTAEEGDDDPAVARDAFLAFACGPSSRWSGNFRDLAASVTRMATQARGGRIAVADVERERKRLPRSWGSAEFGRPGAAANDAVLASVIGLVCSSGAHHGFDIESLAVPKRVSQIPLVDPSGTIAFNADAASHASRRVIDLLGMSGNAPNR